MGKQTLIDSLKYDCDESTKLSTIRKLRNYLTDIEVVRALCFLSLETDSHVLRASIIDILKPVEDMVNPYFVHIATNAKCKILRKWALVNLSLLGCISARAAVIRGLRDSSAIVQQAAALNIGLYHDSEFIQEVQYFFERNSMDGVTFKYAAQKRSSSHMDTYKRSAQLQH